MVPPSQGAILKPIFGRHTHFTVSKAIYSANNTQSYSKLSTILTCSYFSMYLWLPLCLI